MKNGNKKPVNEIYSLIMFNNETYHIVRIIAQYWPFRGVMTFNLAFNARFSQTPEELIFFVEVGPFLYKYFVQNAEEFF